MMISWSKCRPLNRSCAEVGSVIPAVIAGYRAFQQFAPEPRARYRLSFQCLSSSDRTVGGRLCAGRQQNLPRSRFVIILCVRWYITFKLSFRDLVQMMAERGITLSHTTILQWVQQYVPEFEKRWSRYARPVGDSWRVDETYLKIKGQWVYLYRAESPTGRAY